MSQLPKTTVLLDACVLYPASLRDLLMNLALKNLFSPLWSKKINEEWTRNLLKNNMATTSTGTQRTVRAMNRTFLGANIDNYQYLIPDLVLPDPDDRHVLAAAIKSEANRIVTFNLKDFPPDYLRTFNVEVQHPDDFICDLIDVDAVSVKEAFALQVSVLKNPPMTIEEVIAALEKNNLSRTGEKLREIFA